VESGGKVMEFWVDKSLKITKTKKLNERKFFLSYISENHVVEISSNLTENGFE